jgi:DNA helicase TIP49 (TBP-interacting protein)
VRCLLRSLGGAKKQTAILLACRVSFTGVVLVHSNTKFRYCLELLTPASILASLQGRTHLELEDVGEMNELFLDAKASAEAMA